MKKVPAACFLAGFWLSSQALLASQDTAGEVIPDQYIVSFSETVLNHQDKEDFVLQQAERLAQSYGATILYRYSTSIAGVALKLAADRLPELQADAVVVSIEPDTIVRANAVQQNATFGIDRIDARQGTDRLYNFSQTGKGVNAYIVDTGIRSQHQEFTGRLAAGFSAINDGRGTEDCNGHGTHVAGTVGGTQFGVAKEVTLRAVRVLSCSGSGSNSGVIAGVDFVQKNAVKPAVANMSLGGGRSAALDRAVKNAIASGVPFVVAAGNESQNACNTSPANVPEAVTVGATDKTDRKPAFSNFGRCLDIFAPGVAIQSAGISSNTAVATLSGTSMASPHVAGAVALLLEGKPDATPADLAQELTTAATLNVVKGRGTGSPNRFLFTQPEAE